jgi:hypothetical protein
LIAAGLGGGLVTLAFLFLPGMRDIEREGRLRTSTAQDLLAPQPLGQGVLPEPAA